MMAALFAALECVGGPLDGERRGSKKRGQWAGKISRGDWSGEYRLCEDSGGQRYYRWFPEGWNHLSTDPA